MRRVLLVDDHRLVREGLRRSLEEAGFTVVGEAENGADGLRLAEELRPDLVLMDVSMPVMDGITATARIRAVEGPPVLVLTTFDDDEVLWGALQAGAAGFLLKDAPADELIRAIRTVAAGGSWLDQRVTPRVLEVVRSGARGEPPPNGLIERLSEREREVLVLMSHGASNPEIAGRLFVSERTVKGHVGSIFAKLGARDRAAAIILAYESGLVAPGGRPSP